MPELTHRSLQQTFLPSNFGHPTAIGRTGRQADNARPWPAMQIAGPYLP